MVFFSRRSFRWLLPFLALALAAFAFLAWHDGEPAVRYVTAPVTRGDVMRSVTTSGTVNPVTTVQVGTYVSGTIQSLGCDYNTQVKAGQLCAKIDPRPYQTVVDQDKATLDSAAAQLKKDEAALVYAKINYERNAGLRKQGIVAQDTLDTSKSSLDQAEAQVGIDKSTIAERLAALGTAQVNLGYTNIISPVDGTVVSRSIDVGQTVAASFQTPTLFLIAKDLTKMQVDTNVSESDIGGVKLGQKAAFTVEAWPDKTFEGQVTQIRQAPITVQNVVTYDVVVAVDNPDLQLLPGMTANTRIILDERKDVLRVPLAALRYTPHRKKAESGEKPEGVWILRGGKLQRADAAMGLSDSANAEINGGGVAEGDQVVIGEAKGDQKNAAPARSPLRF